MRNRTMRHDVFHTGVFVFMHVLLRMSLAIAVTALLACSESETAPAAQSSSPRAQTAAEAPESASGAGGKATLQKTAAPDRAAVDSAALARRGRAVYSTNCIACHHPDPALDGGIGPAIAGSSFALIEARVMRNTYPEGYKPKRETRAMIALPYLAKDLAALAAYLAE